MWTQTKAKESLNWCLGDLFIDTTSSKKFVEDFVAMVRGGASEHIATLAYKDLPTAELMQEWGDAVQYNPEIIRVKVV